MLAVLLIGTFACAYMTKALGVHPVFGAFLFGAALPRTTGCSRRSSSAWSTSRSSC